MSVSCSLNNYSFGGVALIIDGREATGVWDGDDVVTIEPFEDTATVMVGADGASILSFVPGERVRLTVKLQEYSNAHHLLQNKLNRIKNGLVAPFAISVRDTTSGEGGNSAHAQIIRSPTQAYGKNATSRDWVMFGQCWTWNPVRRPGSAPERIYDKPI
jgi:hypothetical protein